MSNIRSLLPFLILVLGGGITIGIVTAPGEWYDALSKPPFNPPNWVFAPVWTILYIFIALAGRRIWLRARMGAAMKIWGAQLALNFIWSPVFFAAHRMDIGLGIIMLLFGAIIAFIVTSWREDKLASMLFWPYAAWVAFASVLNAALLYLNALPGS
jgi:translocator protein